MDLDGLEVSQSGKAEQSCVVHPSVRAIYTRIDDDRQRELRQAEVSNSLIVLLCSWHSRQCLHHPLALGQSSSLSKLGCVSHHAADGGER